MGLDGDEPHRWPRHCLTNRCRIGRIVLGPLDEALNIELEPEGI
jgi:hypothetical protein